MTFKLFQTNFVTYLFVISLLSCSSIFRPLTKQTIHFTPPKSQRCLQTNKYLYLGESTDLIKKFNTYSLKWGLNHTERVYAWIIANSAIRPDLINLHSSIVIANYQSTQPIDKKINVISLQSIIQKISLSRRKQIREILEDSIPKRVQIIPSLSKSLQNELATYGTKGIPKKFFIAEQILKENDYYQRDNFSHMTLKQDHAYPSAEISSTSKSNRCLSLATKSLPPPTETYMLGVSGENILSLIFISSKASDSFRRPSKASIQASLCSISNSKIDVLMISLKHPNHFELLTQMEKFNIKNIINEQDLMTYIDYPRFYYAKESNKLFIESFRSNREFENYINSLSVPIYHQNQIGVIHGHYHLHQNNRRGLIIEKRDKGVVKCLK